MSLTLRGIDVSKFRVPVWEEVPKEVTIGITRANVGLVVDPTLDEQRASIERTERDFGAYAVLSPWADPIETFSLYRRLVPKQATWPILDVELPYATIAIATKAFKTIILEALKFSKKVIAYSGAWFLDSQMDLSDKFFQDPRILWWLAAYPLPAATFDQAFALYPKHLSLSLPNYIKIENVIGWQFTSNLAPKLKMKDGKMMGVDGNLFDERMLIGEPTPPPPPPVPDPGVNFVNVTIGRLEYPMKFRKGAGTENVSLGGADIGSEFIILQERLVETAKTKEVWGEISKTGLWVCISQFFKVTGKRIDYVVTRPAKFDGKNLF